jgi:ArsR family transcriptional regulator
MIDDKLIIPKRYETLARFCGALSNQRRIALLSAVASNTNCVKDNFVEVEGLNKFAVSMNLKYLKKFGLVNGTFTTKKLQYCINYEKLDEFKGLFDEFYNSIIENKENIELKSKNCNNPKA